jgi:hypothetical protein
MCRYDRCFSPATAQQEIEDFETDSADFGVLVEDDTNIIK